MRKVLCIILACILMVSFVGCKSENDKVTESGDTISEDVGVITVWIPGDENEYAFYFNMFENYKKHVESNGGKFEYKIEQQPWGDYWTKLPLEINNGRGPDLFMPHMAYADVLLPISKELNFSSDLLNKFKVTDLYLGENGKPVFIPTLFVSKIMYANANIVSDMEKYPDRWKDFIELSKTYNDVENGVIGFDYSFHLLWDLGYQNGHMLTNENGVEFNATGLKQILEWTKNGAVDYLQFGKGSPEDSIYENSAAFIYGEPWMEFWAPETAKLRAFPVPGGMTHNYSELSFGINKNVNDAKYEVLNNFIKFMLTDTKTITDIVKGNSGVPNNKEIEVTYEPFTAGDAVKKTFDSNQTNLSVPPSGLESVYRTMLESVLSGTPIDTAINEAKINADGLDVSRLQDMESRFVDRIK